MVPFKKNVLIIALHFAPSAVVGAKRFSFLSKFLYQKNINLHILTIGEKYIEKKDNCLQFSGKVYRTSMLPSFPARGKGIFKRAFNRIWCRYLCMLDPFSGWCLSAFFKGIDIIKKNEIDTIVVTGPPFSPVLIAYLLSFISGSKLVIDYRDPWTSHDWSIREKYGYRLSLKLNRILEIIAIKKASALVFTSDTMQKMFKKKYGRFTTASYHVIHNGFSKDNSKLSLSLDSKRKCIVYAGELYGERRIKLFAAPLRKLIDDNLIAKDTWKFFIFGKLNQEDNTIIKQYDLGEIISEHPLVSHEKIVEYINGATALLLIVGKIMSYSVSYKFYDYIGAQKPILAIVPKFSEMEFMMNTVDCGEIGYIHNERSIKQALQNLLEGNRQYTFSGSEAYTWNAAAAKYLRVLADIPTA